MRCGHIIWKLLLALGLASGLRRFAVWLHDTTAKSNAFECVKYQTWGEEAYKGCEECAYWYPGHVDTCMDCGSKCVEVCPDGGADCYKGDKYVSCHQSCMRKYHHHAKEEPVECSKYRHVGNKTHGGCKRCAHWYPNRLDECMDCGGECAKLCPDGDGHCHHREKYASCHKTCMLKDCYFDEECQKKVDWSKITVLKEGIFKQLKLYRATHAKDQVKVLLARAHRGFADAGVPEDRIDYILTKWVKSVYPEALEEDHPHAIECNKYKPSGAEAYKGDCEGCAQWYSGRVDECMGCAKECVNVCPHGDEECYQGVEFRSCHTTCMQKEERTCDKYKPWGDKAYQGCKGCATWSPNRVDECMGCGKTCAVICAGGDDECYHGEKFVSCHRTCMQKDLPLPDKESEAVAAMRSVDGQVMRLVGEDKEAGNEIKSIDEKDCYSDEECHKKVDWSKIAVLKEGIFKRIKFYRAAKAKGRVKMLLERSHGALVDTGMPEDRIDYILTKWLKSVYPEAVEEDHPQAAECKKYKPSGAEAYKGCEGCAQWYSGRVDECMDCGKNCAALCPQGGAECYKGEHFVACHRSCMQGPPHAGEEPIECEKYQSWGTHAYKDCGGCTRDYPGRVDDCMGCGKQCAEMCAPGDEECYKGEKFGSCHKTCMLKQDPTGHNETGDCGKYRSLGNEAVKGCEGCAFWYPRRVGECMSCGGQCAHFCPQGGDECYHGEKFASCHKTCMFKAAPKPDKKQELVDKKDCYFDEECRKQVDWNKIGALKRSIFQRLKVMRQTQNPTGVKDLMELAHTAFAQAGMPENRIDYTLTKWVDSVYPEAFEEKLDRNALQEGTPSVELIV